MSQLSRSRAQRLTLLALAALLAGGVLFTGASRGQGGEPMEVQMRFIDMMGRYLELSRNFVGMASDPPSAAYMAVEGIVEVYENRGEKRRAIGHLERLLEQHGDDRALRTLIRFKLRDLYNETGQSDKALEQLDRVVAESAG